MKKIKLKLYLKDDEEEEKYSQYLEEYTIRSLVTKYSDYLRYPIQMEVTNRKLKEGSDSEYEDVKEIYVADFASTSGDKFLNGRMLSEFFKRYINQLSRVLLSAYL